MGELAILLRDPPGHDGSTWLGIIGPLTHATSAVLRDYLRRVLDTTVQPWIVLDMSCCTGIDMGGLLALDVAQHAARLRRGDLRLTATPALIARQIQQHNFEHLLDDCTRGGSAH